MRLIGEYRDKDNDKKSTKIMLSRTPEKLLDRTRESDWANFQAKLSNEILNMQEALVSGISNNNLNILTAQKQINNIDEVLEMVLDKVTAIDEKNLNTSMSSPSK